MINHRYVHNLASFLLIPELSQATLKLALFVGLLLYEIIHVLFVKAKKKKKKFKSSSLVLVTLSGNGVFGNRIS